MKNTILKSVLLSALLSTAACGQNSAIEGHWAIDLEAMVAQARSIGATDRDLQMVRETFEGGRAEIDARKITLTIAGVTGKDVRGYTVESKDGSCLVLKVEPSTDLHRYCVDGRRLEVRDPSTKLVVVYNKT